MEALDGDGTQDVVYSLNETVECETFDYDRFTFWWKEFLQYALGAGSAHFAVDQSTGELTYDNLLADCAEEDVLVIKVIVSILQITLVKC